MSKLFGQVGRVDKRVLVQTFFCPYQASRYVGQTQFGQSDICPNFCSFFWDPSLSHIIFLFLDLRFLSKVSFKWSSLFLFFDQRTHFLYSYTIYMPSFKLISWKNSILNTPPSPSLQIILSNNCVVWRIENLSSFGSFLLRKFSIKRTAIQLTRHFMKELDCKII